MKKGVLLALLCGLMLYGCGSSGGGGGTVSPSESTLGVAVDPYLVGSVFCIDEDLSGTCDDGETESTPSDENGTFSFSAALSAGDVVLMKEAGTHNGVPYQFGGMKAVYNGTSLVVSPLTTLTARGLTPEQVVALLDPDGTLGITEDMVNEDPVASLSGSDDSISEESLALVRASIGAYMVLRMMESDTGLAALTGGDIADSPDVQAIAQYMMGIITRSISTDSIAAFQTAIDGQNQALPDVVVMDVVHTAVSVCDQMMEVAEAAYRDNSGDISAAMLQVENYADTNIDDIVSAVGPYQYVNRLLGENPDVGSAVQTALGYDDGLFECEHGVQVQQDGSLECYSGDISGGEPGGGEPGGGGETLGDESRMIADAPEIKYDFDNTDFASVNRSAARAASDDSGGACFTYGVRYNASWYVPQADFFRCTFSKVAEAGLIEDIADGVMYVKFVTDGIEHAARLTYADNSAVMNMCYGGTPGDISGTDQENVRVSIEKTETGYNVESVMILDNDYNGSAEGGEVEDGFKIYASAQVAGGVEAYSFILHFLNEQSADCQGTSGASLDGTDDRCFLRYQGDIYHNLTADEMGGVNYSLYNGLFSEKLHDLDNPDTPDVNEERSFVSGGRFSTVVSGGMGYSTYSFLNSDAVFTFGDPVSETWTAASLLRDFANSLNAYLGTLDQPERTAVIPAIADPWNCQADSFVTIDLDSLEGMSSCYAGVDALPGFNGAGDLTTCSEDGSKEMQELMEDYRCQEDDPMTLGASGCSQAQ